MSSRSGSRQVGSAVIALVILGVSANLAVSASAFAASKIVLGKKLFLANCSSCHGERGDGNGPAAASFTTKPRNFIGGTWLEGTSAQDLVQIMTSGLPATGMPSFQALPDGEKRAIAAFIKTLKK